MAAAAVTIQGEETEQIIDDLVVRFGPGTSQRIYTAERYRA